MVCRNDVYSYKIENTTYYCYVLRINKRCIVGVPNSKLATIWLVRHTTYCSRYIVLNLWCGRLLHIKIVHDINRWFVTVGVNMSITHPAEMIIMPANICNESLIFRRMPIEIAQGSVLHHYSRQKDGYHKKHGGMYSWNQQGVIIIDSVLYFVDIVIVRHAIYNIQ